MYAALFGDHIMSEIEQMQRGRQLLIDGRSDEDVEYLTGISLLQIIGLRGDAAAGPAFSMSTETLPPR